MKTYVTKNQLMAAAAILVAASGTQTAHAGLVVDLDLRSLGNEGDFITSLTNTGTAGNFTAPSGQAGPQVATVGGVQGLDFNNTRLNSAMLNDAVGLSGNNPYSVAAWVFNPSIGQEETIVAWGHRGGPPGSNIGFHQGTQGTFGAVGHWGGPDVGWGAGDIAGTTGVWSHLAVTYDGTEENVFINGLVANTKTQGALVVHTGVPIAIGSENADGSDFDTVAVGFTGVMGSLQVHDTALTPGEIATLAAQGIPEPSSFLLTMLGSFTLCMRRRRK